MNALGIIFSNIHDNDLPELTSVRTMGSVPFCGRYRLIDFPLSNMVNSGITKVGLITKSNFQSLMDHVGSGKDWDLARRNGGLMLLPPFGDKENSVIYNTRLEALKGVIGFLTKSTEEYVFMSDSDMVCSMDFNEIMDYHVKKDADITMVYQTVENSNYLGVNKTVLNLDKNKRVSTLTIDPKTSGKIHLYNNIMLVKRNYLINLVSDAIAHGNKHFTADILAKNVKTIKIYGYEYNGYLSLINSLQTYYDTSMKMLDKKTRDEVFKTREVFTKIKDSTPTKFGENAVISNSLIAEGCVIEGEVYNSIIFRNVKVSRGTVVRNSILMQNTITGENVSLNAIITDKNVLIRDKRTLSGCDTHPFYIAKNSVI